MQVLLLVYHLDEDFSRALRILVMLSKDQSLHDGIAPRSIMEWFAVSKYYREKIRMHQDDLGKIRVYIPEAVNAFLKAENPYSAKKILSFYINKSIEKGDRAALRDAMEILEKIGYDITDDIVLDAVRGLLIYDIDKALHLIRNILTRDDVPVENKRRFVRIILYDVANINADLVEEILNILKNIDYLLYLEALGLSCAMTKSEEWINRLLDAIEYASCDGLVMILWGLIWAKEIQVDLVALILREILGKGNALCIKHASWAVMDLLDKGLLKGDLGKIVEEYIQRLFGYNQYLEATNLSLKYALAMLEKDKNKSRIFLDVAINMCYIIDSTESIPKIYGEYISKVMEKYGVRAIEGILSSAYSENTIKGLRNIDIWSPIVLKIKTREDIIFLEKLYRKIYNRTDVVGRKLIKDLLLLGRLRVADREELPRIMNRIIKLGNTFLALKMIKEIADRGLVDSLVEVIKIIANSENEGKYLTTVIYAIISKLVEFGEVKKIHEALDIIYGLEAQLARDLLAGLLIELGILLIDNYEDLGCDFLATAFNYFRELDMKWMSLNALAILAAHKELDIEYIG